MLGFWLLVLVLLAQYELLERGWVVRLGVFFLRGGVMKSAAFILNLIQIGFWLYLLADKGFPSGDDVFLFAAMLAVPLVNLIAIFGKNKADVKSDGFVSLYLKRLALEEKKKIEKLQEK